MVFTFSGKTKTTEASPGRSCFGSIMLIWAVTLTITALLRKLGIA